MKRFGLILLVALALGALAWFFWPLASDRVREAQAEKQIAATQKTDGTGSNSTSTAAAAPSTPTEVSHLADDLNSPIGDIQSDLHIVGEILSTFRSNFPRTGNPAGNNAEITASLTGKNSLRLALIPPHHPAINVDGELCDRWGQPFFFHQLGATKMEIHSAGPDRKMWTDDDVVFTP